MLDKLLTLDPAKRIDSSTALDHDFFWTDPMPCDLSKMLSQHTQVRLLCDLCCGHFDDCSVGKGKYREEKERKKKGGKGLATIVFVFILVLHFV